MASKNRIALSLLLAAGILVAVTQPSCAGDLPVTVENLVWDPETGTASFEFVNTSDQAVTAWYYAGIFRYVDGEEIVTWLGQDAAAGAGLSEGPPERAVATGPLQPGERRTQEMIFTAPTYKKEGLASPPLELEVVALVFNDTSALGGMFWVHRIRDNRLNKVRELALWLHAIENELYAKDSEPSFQRLSSRMSSYNESAEPFSKVDARVATSQMRVLLDDVELSRRSSEDALLEFERTLRHRYENRLLHLTPKQQGALILAEQEDLAMLPDENDREEE